MQQSGNMQSLLLFIMGAIIAQVSAMNMGRWASTVRLFLAWISASLMLTLHRTKFQVAKVKTFRLRNFVPRVGTQNDLSPT